VVQINDYKNIHEMIKVTIDAYPEKKAYQWITDNNGNTESVTWNEFYSDIRNVSRSLIKLGIAHGDRVCILSYTSYRWVLTDVANAVIGACTVGIYHSNLPGDCQYIISHSGSKVVFVEDLNQLEKVLSVKKKIPGVKKIILMKGVYTGKEKNRVMTFAEFLELGNKVTDKTLDARIKKVKASDLATIVYTSGTTGKPKGVMITHDNIIFSSQSVYNCADVFQDDETFIFLPLAHIFARLNIYLVIIIGSCNTFARSIETIIDDIQVARPHWFASVPRIFEKVYTRILGGAEAKGGLALALFNWSVNTGGRVSDLLAAGKKPGPLLSLQYKIATKLIFSRIQNALGGRVRFCVSGAAPLNPIVARFFHSAGILICEGYGMTENMSFTNVNRYNHFKFGTVGPPGPGVEQRIADDGEILFRGRNVMKGYYRDKKGTAEVIDRNGWIHTGDLGIIDEDDFLTITGRKKEILITSGGKNIAPGPIEGVLGTCQYINQVMLIGDKRKYVSALITLDPDNIKEFAERNEIAYSEINDLNSNKEVLGLIAEEVEKVNAGLASFESIKKFTLVPEFTIENELITATLKLKKNAIQKKFKNEIDTMYPPD
jgi:long-chain acyl-CoA synthetase